MTKRYVDLIFQCIKNQNSLKLADLFNIRHKEWKNIYFNEADKRYLNNLLSQCSNEITQWSEIIEYHVLARNSIKANDFQQAFDYQSKSFKCLIDLLKDAKDENWQLPILFSESIDLRLISYACDLQLKLSGTAGNLASGMGDMGEQDSANYSPSYAEKTAECLMVCFRNLCTDTRSDSQVSKRWGMMHIVNQLFKIYFKINKMNLCNPLKRVVENSGLKESFPQSHQITYKFYVGRQAMFDNDYNTASNYFQYAFQNCPDKYIKNKKIILVYLIPIQMLRGYMPNYSLLIKYDLKPFAELSIAIKQGNIAKFNRDMIEYEDYFIQLGVYLFMEKLKMITYRNLFKKCAILLKTPQIPIDAFVDILHFLNDDDMDNDVCQCILSNLIYEGKIKGYISHKFNKLVISKDFKVAFPKLTTSSFS